MLFSGRYHFGQLPTRPEKGQTHRENDRIQGRWWISLRVPRQTFGLAAGLNATPYTIAYLGRYPSGKIRDVELVDRHLLLQNLLHLHPTTVQVIAVHYFCCVYFKLHPLHCSLGNPKLL